MRLTTRMLAALWAGLLATMGTAQDRPEHGGRIALFGTLHAHSELSGDVKAEDGFTPREAFDYAREHGLDFLGISDHHKPPRASGSNRFHLKDSAYENDLFAVAESINFQHAGSFVAIPGIEWGTIATGNHINVFGAPSLPPDHIRDDDYDELYPWIREHALFAQFNHPYSWGSADNRRLDVGNYGRALFGSTPEFVEVADPAVSLISVICTVKGGHLEGEHADSEDKTHRDTHKKALPAYKRLLNQGFRISPAANQDTHGENPGAVTAARTGVWVDDGAFSLLGIADAVKANRVFATEDDELAVALLAQHGGKTYWMGETVPLGVEMADITLVVHASQRLVTGGDSANEDQYQIDLFRDKKGPGGQTARKKESFTLSGAADLTVTVPVQAGEYLFARISELDGEDNPVGEGRPGDMNDVAWTSPLWFSGEDALAEFVWSKNSVLFHDPECWAAKRISSTNRREGAAPDGKRKHDCPR